jgi:hypothetical protein
LIPAAVAQVLKAIRKKAVMFDIQTTKGNTYHMIRPLGKMVSKFGKAKVLWHKNTVSFERYSK